MKPNISKILFVVLFILLSFFNRTDIYAQNDSTGTFQFRAYVITLNKDYFIYTLDDEIIKGRIVGNNKDEILTSTEDGLIAVKKDNIRTITTEYPNVKVIEHDFSLSKYTTIWSFGGGIVIPQQNYHFNANHNFNSAGDYQKGFSICARATTPFSRFAALKTELDFTHIPNGENIDNTSYYSSRQSGGTINEITFKCGIGFGNFIPREQVNFNMFISLGAGMEFKDESKFYETQTGYYAGNYVYSVAAFSRFVISIGLSGAVFVNIKNFGIFLEPQINFYSISNTPVQIGLKAGVFF